MNDRLPSRYRRNFPEWAPDLIQRFVPNTELNRKENYRKPPKRVIREEFLDPFT